MRLSLTHRHLAPAVIATVTALFSTAPPFAQVKTETTTTAAGQPTQVVDVERGEVVYLSGNDLVVKMASGEIRHFANVPESVRINVDGKELGIHDLKVGMKLERTITTTTKPRMVKTVQSVTGKVWQVQPPNAVILTLEDGKNQRFTIPKGQKFMVNGEEVDASGLKKGMKISATKIVETPEDVVTKESKITGTLPPAPSAPPANLPILVVEEGAKHGAVKKPAPPSQAAPEKHP